MDDATMATVRAVVLGLRRSGAIDADQYDTIVNELTLAASVIRSRDDLGALQIEYIADGLLQAAEDGQTNIT